MKIPESRSISFLIITIVYLLATAVGILTYAWAADQMAPLWALLLADVVATILTWAFGISIPLMESRQLKNKPGYAQYKKGTRRLI